MPIQEAQLTNKQHAVPQNFMDVEFKLIGDLTMRQFTYLLICGGIGYLASVTVVGIFKWPLVIFFVLFGLALAFVPVQERGLDQWVINFFKSVYSPNQKIWKKDVSLPQAFLYQNLEVVRQELITLTPTSSRRKLEEYLENQGNTTVVDRLDIPEEEYILKVRQSFMDNPGTPVITSAPTLVAEPVVETKKPEIKEAPVVAPISSEEPKPEIVPAISSPPVVQTPKPLPVAVSEAIPQSKPSPTPTEQKPKQETHEKVTPREEARKKIEDIKNKIRHEDRINLPNRHDREVLLTPMTPDRHSGRKFTSLLPSVGEIVLPIRGERVIDFTDDKDIEDDMQKKTQQLKDLMDQIVSEEAKKKPQNQSRPTEPKPLPQEPKEEQKPQPTKPIEMAKPVETPKQVPSSIPIEKPVEIVKTKDEPKSFVHQPEELNRLEEQNKKLEKELENLKEYLKQKDTKTLDVSDLAALENYKTSMSEEKKPEQLNDVPSPLTPNLISGVVLAPDDAFIEGIVIIVKNERKEPVRAIKTNKLGQFSLSNPVVDGTYTLEVVNKDQYPFTFDIISVQAKGDLIDPLQIKGKS